MAVSVTLRILTSYSSSSSYSYSYLSKPKEIDAADLQLTRLELDLQNEIDRVETDYPGYDEYSYNLGAIGHNPFTLIGYLSAVHTEFTASEVESEIQALFDEMYTLRKYRPTGRYGNHNHHKEQRHDAHCHKQSGVFPSPYGIYRK